MLRSHGKGASVREPAVEALADEHVDRVAVARSLGVALEQVTQSALPDRPHRQGAREQDRTLDRAELLELAEAGRLAVAVDDVAGPEHLLRVEVAAMRQDRRHAGSAPAHVERAVPDENAGHVHERVQLSRGKTADRIAELT